MNSGYGGGGAFTDVVQLGSDVNFRPSTNFYSVVYSNSAKPRVLGITNLFFSWDSLLLNGRRTPSPLSKFLYNNPLICIYSHFLAATPSTPEQFETDRLCTHHENNNFYFGGRPRYAVIWTPSSYIAIIVGQGVFRVSPTQSSNDIVLKYPFTPFLNWPSNIGAVTVVGKGDFHESAMSSYGHSIVLDVRYIKILSCTYHTCHPLSHPVDDLLYMMSVTVSIPINSLTTAHHINPSPNTPCQHTL